MDFTKLSNPIIRVDWEDVPEAFTQERIKRIKHYFQEKYKTKNVVVKPITIVDKSVNAKLRTLEMSDSILDPQFQKQIVREYIQENGITIEWEFINRLDDKVNAELKKDDGTPPIRHNRWSLNKIEFSNFLSYGPDNVMDYTRLGGITVIESNPPNFGGKTVLSVDLIMFLLFNSTTKSNTQEDIFNQFSDANEVRVKGYMEIDGIEYTIERKLTRKRKKNGEWDVKAELKYQKWAAATSQYEDESEESRPVTEKLITGAIGTKEDFLTTILTTGNNLESLLEAKATARGQLLTRFLGLESLRKKEEVCKNMFAEWSKKLVSNQHNIKQLQEDILNLQEDIKLKEANIVNFNQRLEVDTKELELLNTQKDTLLIRKHQDVDRELAKIDPVRYQQEITVSQQKVIDAISVHDLIVVKEPETYYHDNQHAEVQTRLNIEKVTLQVTTTEGTKIANQVKEMKEGKDCPTCKRPLDDVDHTEEIENLEQLLSEKREAVKITQTNIKDIEAELQRWADLKKQFDDYDRNKLRKERASLDIEQRKMELSNKQNLFAEWEKNRTKLEENVQIEQQLVTVRTSVDRKVSEIEGSKEAIRGAERAITQGKISIEDKQIWIEKIKKEEGVQKVFTTYLSIFGKNGISKSIMRNMIPLINQELVRILSDTCYFSLVININDKNEVEFTMVDNETQIGKPMSSGSGYEKTVAALALRSVLSKVSALPKPNVIVMDEIFGKIADDNLDMVGEFFLKIKSYFEHILLITHNPLIKNWSDNVITIRKENNISYIENQTGA
jgi:DNA repair exonuclease SbcCD ATPase subunit